MKKTIIVGYFLVFVFLSFIFSFSVEAIGLLDNFINFGRPFPNSFGITSLLLDENEKIVGATYDPSRLFIFDPVDKSFSEIASPPANPHTVIWGNDGTLYGGGSGGLLWSYDFETNTFTNLGSIPGGRRIIGLAIGRDGLIYIGTEKEDRHGEEGALFSFDPATGVFVNLGTLPGESSIGYALISGPEGEIYGGTYPHANLFSFDPVQKIFHNHGQPIANQRSINSLVVGSDGKIYGGVQDDGHLFVYDPITHIFTDLGRAVDNQARITSLIAVGNRIYGGTGNFGRSAPHLFVYDIMTQAFIDLGVPVSNDRMIESLVTTEKYIYGGTGFGGYFFAYILPTIASNFTNGAPGSYFTFQGSGLPVNSTATITVNAHLLGTIPVDEDGDFTFLLTTDMADEGTYFVTVSNGFLNVTTRFDLDANKPVREKEGEGSIINVPAGISFTETMYLPSILR